LNHNHLFTAQGGRYHIVYTHQPVHTNTLQSALWSAGSLLGLPAYLLSRYVAVVALVAKGYWVTYSQLYFV